MLSRFESMGPALSLKVPDRASPRCWPTPKLDKHNQKPHSLTETLTLGLLRMLGAGTGTEMGTESKWHFKLGRGGCSLVETANQGHLLEVSHMDVLS